MSEKLSLKNEVYQTRIKKIKNNDCKNIHVFLLENFLSENEPQKPKSHKKNLKRIYSLKCFFQILVFPRVLKVIKLSKF